VGLTRFRFRVELRGARRWMATVLLLGLAGGAALTAAQAARRTDSAYTRVLVAGHASDVVVNANTYSPIAKQANATRARGIQLLDTVDRSPLVTAHGRFGGANLFRFVHGRLDQHLNTGSAFGLVAYDTHIGRTIARLRVAHGRLARTDRADEITITPTTAALTGWHVGTVVTDLREYDNKDLDPETGAPDAAHGTPLRLHVVGIAQLPEEYLQEPADRQPRVYLTPAYARRFPDTVFYLNEWIRLRHGAADLPALRRAVTVVNRAAPEISMPIAPTVTGLVRANRANDPLVNGLWILAALAAVVGILLAAQALGRTFGARSDDHAQLRALGATRRQRLTGELVWVAGLALAAALLAALVAWLCSPLTPIGSARDAEPHPGFSLNIALSALAIVAIFLGTTLAALPAIIRLATVRSLPGMTPSDARERRSRVADLVARSGLGPRAVVGTRLALQPGRGPTATPVRSVLTSLTLVVAAVTATFAFGANLQRWTTTPRLYGWNWDAAAGTNFGAIPPEFEHAVERFHNVSEVSGLTVGLFTAHNQAIPAIGITPLRGSVAPALDAGRLPENTREIVLGAKTMRTLHTHIGATVSGTIDDHSVRLRVVGRTTFPAFGNGRFAESGLGTGALGTTQLFPVHDEGEPGGHFGYLLLRFTPGTATRTEHELRAWLAPRGCSDPTCVLSDSRPTEISGYRSARGLPIAIAVVLVLLLVATLTHVLVSTLRRRSADMAVLRAIGYRPRDLAATLRWQALVLTGTAIVIGIPIGIVAGRLTWAAFTSQLGIAPGTVVPLLAMTAAAIALLALAWLLATLAGLRVPKIARRHRFTG
jgi:hypothetical protein